jgi:hypothetical protein
MRQEIKFCADIYRLLFDKIDTDRECYICLDGAATEKGVRERLLLDVSMPDFYWYFRRAQTAFRMEAKVVRNGKVSFCGDGQARMWCSDAKSVYKPVLWLGLNESSPLLYYVWEHAGFDQMLVTLVGRGRTKSGKKKQLKLNMPAAARTFTKLSQVVRHVMSYAKQHGYFPNKHR